MTNLAERYVALCKRTERLQDEIQILGLLMDDEHAAAHEVIVKNPSNI